MRKYAVMALLLLITMVFCPLAAMGAKSGDEPAAAPALSDNVVNETEYITVMSSATGNSQKIEMREYLIGCVAAEMLPSYHEEALKAQVVASYTYAKRVTENSDDFITDSPLTHQGYADRQTRMENWGADFEKNEQKISQAVDAVYGYSVKYGGETALSLYHSISAGQTQSAETLWGEDYPYLQSVQSQGDRLSPDFISRTVFETDDFADLLGVNGEGDASEWVEEIKSEEGYVVSAVICGKKFTGAQIRDSLELKSTAFEILCENEKITVTCKGHGHGVGMSQYGADYMARQGSNWREILLHYYPSATVEKTAV